METQNVNILQHKSNAPWICGIIAFIASIPNAACATLCAAVGTAAVSLGATADASLKAEQGLDNANSLQTAETAGDFFASSLLLFFAITIGCFILSFMGKSKFSVITGILMVLGGLYILVNGFIGLGNMMWGSIAGTCYLIGGIYSIINHKRID